MRYLALAILLLPTLAACSEPEVKEPKATSTPTSSPTPSLTPPTIPAQAKEDSPEGAAAFVASWVATSNYAAHTGDTRDLQEFSTSDCSGCHAYERLYREIYEDGGFLRGSDWSLSEVRVRDTGSRTLVYAHVSAPSGTYATTGDGAEKRGNAENSDLVFELLRRSDGWRLNGLAKKN